MKWTRRLQNYGLITLIAALVWLYAEGEGVQEEPFDVLLQIPSQLNEDIVVDVVRPEDRPVVTLMGRGNASRIGELRAMLGPAPRLTVPLTIDDLPPDRRGPITLEPLVAQARVGPAGQAGPTLSDLGVSIVSIDPPTFELAWERLVNQPIKIRFDPDNVDLAPGVRIEPTEVQATMPQWLVNRYAGSEDVYFAEARVPPALLRDMPEGTERTFPAELQLSPLLQGRDHVTLETTTAYVTFAVARKRATTRLEAVPVWLLAPPSELVRFDVQLDDESRVLKDVTITGPTDLISRIKSDNGAALRVVARLELTGSDLERATERAGGQDSAMISMIELQQITDGVVRTVEMVPLNSQALAPGADPSLPTFSSGNLAVRVASPEVHFTITRKTE
jgi:hypothetical protein